MSCRPRTLRGIDLALVARLAGQRRVRAARSERRPERPERICMWWSGAGCYPHSPRLRLGLSDRRHFLPIVRSRGRHAQTPGNLCDSRATPRRPSGHPVAKSPGDEHATAGEPIRHRIDDTRIPRVRAWGFLTGGKGVGEQTRRTGEAHVCPLFTPPAPAIRRSHRRNTRRRRRPPPAVVRDNWSRISTPHR